MSEKGIPEPIRRFVLANLHSVDQLEVLLHLFKHSEREWSAEEVGGVHRTSPLAAEARLADLYGRGLLLRRVERGETLYRFAAQPELKVVIERLAQFYSSHHVRIIELIYSRPAEAIRSFAEAFRIRKDGE
jgi:hypothetical protein